MSPGPDPVEPDNPKALLFPEYEPGQRVRIFREDERDARFAFHGYYPAEEASEERINQAFGGGKWKGQLVGKNEAGQEVIRKTVTIRIPGPYRPPQGELPGTQPAAPAPPLVGQVHTIPGPAGADAKLVDLIEALTKRTEGRGADWGAIMALVIPVVGKIIEKMMDRRSGPDPELTAQLAQVQRDIAGLRQGPATSAIGDAVKAIRELLDVKDMISGGGEPARRNDPDDKLWSMGEKLVGMLGAGAASRTPVPAPPPVPVPEIPAVTERSTYPLWQQMLLNNGPRLLDAASRGMDPELAADVAAQFLPENLVGVAQEFLRKEDAATLLVQVLPALREFPDWCGTFLAHFRETMLGDGEGASPNAG